MHLPRSAISALWLSGDRLLRMGVGLVVTAGMARQLGPAAYGLFGYALALCDLASPLARLGLDTVVVRDVTREPARAGEILGTAALLRLGGGLLAAALAIAAVLLLRPAEPVTLAVVALAALALPVQMADVVDFWFQSRVDARRVFLARNLAFGLASLLRLALILAAASVVAYAGAWLLETALAALLLALFFRRTPGAPAAWTATRRAAAALLATSWPLILSGVGVLLYLRVDQVMLGQLLDDRALGHFTAAVRLSEVWYFIPGALVTSVLPSLVALRQTDPARYQDRLRQLFALMTVAARAIAAPVSLAAGPLVTLLFGEAFRPAAAILVVHVWSCVFVFWGVAQGPWILAEDATRLTIERMFTAAALKIGLNLLLIPRFGAVGAAYASLAAYAYSGWLANAVQRRTRPLFRLQMEALRDSPRLARQALRDLRQHGRSP